MARRDRTRETIPEVRARPEQARQQQLAVLQKVEDPRAKALADALQKKGWKEDEVDTLLAGETAEPVDAEAAALRRLAQLQAPAKEAAKAIAKELRDADARTKATANTLAKKSKDLADIPANVTEGMKIVPVRWIDEVLDLALERPLRPAAADAPAGGGKGPRRRQRPAQDANDVKH